MGKPFLASWIDERTLVYRSKIRSIKTLDSSWGFQLAPIASLRFPISKDDGCQSPGNLKNGNAYSFVGKKFIWPHVSCVFFVSGNCVWEKNLPAGCGPTKATKSSNANRFTTFS